MSVQPPEPKSQQAVEPTQQANAYGQTTPANNDISAAQRPHVKRNYLSYAIEGGLFVGGIAFVSADSVLPALFSLLEGPKWMIAFLPTMMMIGFSLAPLFTAHIVERLERVKGLCLVFGVLQRIPYLAAGLILWFWGKEHPYLCATAAALAPFFSGLFGGISLSGFFTLVARILPIKRRASASALRNIIGSTLGIIAGAVVNIVLTHYPGTDGYAILHFLAFLCLTGSWLMFANLKEVDAEEARTAPRRTLRDHLKSLPELCRGDKHLKHLIITRFLAGQSFMLIPYMALYAKSTTAQDDSFIGILITWQMIGGLLGNLLAAWLGDTQGGKSIVMVARITFLASCALIITGESMLAFKLAFFMLGIHWFMNMVGLQTFTMELAPKSRVATYTAIVGMANMVALLVAGGLASLLMSDLVGPVKTPVLALIAAVCDIASIYFLLIIPEPRKTGLHSPG